jgi:hypothetical protein
VGRVVVLPLLCLPSVADSAVTAIAETIGEVDPAEVVLAGLRGESVDDRAVHRANARLVTFVDRLRQSHRGAINVVGMADDSQNSAVRGIGLDSAVIGAAGLTEMPSVYPIAPGWCVMGRRRSVREHRAAAGVNALAAARGLGGSVILGDTGRLGIGSLVKQAGGATVRIVGVEAGAPIDLRATDGSVDRRRYSDRGFAVITINDDDHVDAECRTL